MSRDCVADDLTATRVSPQAPGQVLPVLHPVQSRAEGSQDRICQRICKYPCQVRSGRVLKCSILSSQVIPYCRSRRVARDPSQEDMLNMLMFGSLATPETCRISMKTMAICRQPPTQFRVYYVTEYTMFLFQNLLLVSPSP